MLALKYIIFFGALLVGVPLLTVWTTRHPRRLRGVATVHAFSIAFCIWVINFFRTRAIAHVAGDGDQYQRPALALLGRGSSRPHQPAARWWAYGLYFLAGVIRWSMLTASCMSMNFGK